MFRERKRRDRLYIIAEVLEIAKNGSLKTQIMYQANLSFAQLNNYLSFLLEVGLLKETSEEGKTVYRTTKKAVKFLRNYYKIRDLLRGKSERGEKNNLNNSACACEPNKAQNHPSSAKRSLIRGFHYHKTAEAIKS
jgi:predicted transcriptional regulator